MRTYIQGIAAAALALCLPGCKFAIINPEGGTVYSQSATRDCTPGKVCTFDIDTTVFSESFTAVAAPGYAFEKWRAGDRFICDDSTNPTCTLALAGDQLAQTVVDSHETFYAMPKFVFLGGPVSPAIQWVAESQDDVEESGTLVHLESASLNFEPGNNVGLRFPNIMLPQGALITNAYIEVTQNPFDDAGHAFLTIEVEGVANAAPYTTADGALDARIYEPWTTLWEISSTWREDASYQSPDLTNLVQPTVSRGDWEAGNAIAFRITSAGPYDRNVYSFDGSTGDAPRLVIEFQY